VTRRTWWTLRQTLQLALQLVMPMLQKPVAVIVSPRPFGPGLFPAEVVHAERMEIWGTSASDPGSDYVEFRLVDKDGEVIRTKKVDGY